MTRSLTTYWGSPRIKILKRDFRAALRTNSGEAASAACTTIGLSHLLLPVFPEKHIHLLCSLIGSPAFARSPDAAGSILVFLMTESHKLSSRQKRRLVREFVCIYPKVTEQAWFICFSISELVGSNFRDEAALEMFLRLVDVPRPRTRAFVAHGLEHIVCDSDNPSLAFTALQALEKMALDPAESVRMQVEESLLIIERDRNPSNPESKQH
jgi:hypothetical protein